MSLSPWNSTQEARDSLWFSESSAKIVSHLWEDRNKVVSGAVETLEWDQHLVLENGLSPLSYPTLLMLSWENEHGKNSSSSLEPVKGERIKLGKSQSLVEVRG